jgi:hypothetical protein
MDETLEISRGQAAKKLLENPLLKEALETIKQRCRDKSEASLPSQPEVREAAYWLMCAAKEFEAHLTNFLNTGKLATSAQAQREDQSNRERYLAEWDGSPDGAPGGNTDDGATDRR